MYDVIVIGAGHAGVEAAWAASRLGLHVGICTLSKETVAMMPCNPAIGGTAKGHLVREIDALGGLMGQAIDATGIQFKLLNRSRGPAVWSPRAQADKREYGRWVCEQLEAQSGIDWLVGRAGRILADHGRVVGLAMEGGDAIACRTLVVTTGTFLNGLVHVGREQRPAGRAGEPPTQELAESIKRLEFARGRLKTGTPPRLARQSIDFEAGCDRGVFTPDRGDASPVPFSFDTDRIDRPRIACWQLHTNEQVRALVLCHLAASPLFNGQIRGVGPRYCPSLEDKIVRFPERERHLLFLEPEGLDVDEVYVNGLSMSLPADVQLEIVHALRGLEDAEMIRPGYAVEYDFVQPTELASTLETHRIRGLFFAGQVNGTSGYEEAAAQGLVAGANAGLQVLGRTPFTVKRDEGYIGVLVDDLVTRGCLEPYRMFTSRAEHRLLLRIDNADLRLTEKGRRFGLVGDAKWERFEARKRRYANNLSVVAACGASPDAVTAAQARAMRGPVDGSFDRIESMLDLAPAHGPRELDLTSLRTALRFEGYLRREAANAVKRRQFDDVVIPAAFAYANVPGLSHEVVQRLNEVRPETIGQAGRIPGVTPAAVAVLSALVPRFHSPPMQT